MSTTERERRFAEMYDRHYLSSITVDGMDYVLVGNPDQRVRVEVADDAAEERQIEKDRLA